MKKILFVICSFLAVSLFYSCKKCLKCEYYITVNKADSGTYIFPDACGSKRDMQIFEDSLKKRTDEKRVIVWDSTRIPPKKYTPGYRCVDITDKLL